jgi:hypothetical protein
MSEATTTESAPMEPSGEQTPPEQQQEAAAAAPAPAAETAAERRIRIAREGGGEEELSPRDYVERLIEIHGEDGLRNIGGLGQITRRKLSELGASKRQIDEALQDLADPKRALRLIEKKHGREAARRALEEWYAEDVEERSLDPKAREERKRLSSLDERERTIAEKEARWREQEEQRVAAELQPQLGAQFKGALQRAGAEAATPLMIGKMAAIVEAEIADARAKGHRVTREDFQLIVNDAARAVASKHYEEVAADVPRLPEAKRMALVQQVVGTMKPEQLAQLLGEQGVRAFRRWDAERVRAKQATPVAQQPKPRDGGGQREKAPVHVDDWLKERW